MTHSGSSSLFFVLFTRKLSEIFFREVFKSEIKTSHPQHGGVADQLCPELCSLPHCHLSFPHFSQGIWTKKKEQKSQKKIPEKSLCSKALRQERRNPKILEVLRLGKVSEHQAHPGHSQKLGISQELKLNPSSRPHPGGQVNQQRPLHLPGPALKPGLLNSAQFY